MKQCTTVRVDQILAIVKLVEAMGLQQEAAVIAYALFDRLPGQYDLDKSNNRLDAANPRLKPPH